MSRSAVIIGGGIGGLFTGAFLARNGIRVTVLEKNAVAGGGFQCFSRHGKQFETGMHVMGGFTPDGKLTRICRYLGILDSLEIRDVPEECMDEIIYDAPGETFRIPSGRENYIRYFSTLFPEEAQGIRDYIDTLYRITDEFPLYWLRERQEGISGYTAHSELFSWSADSLIDYFVKNPKLRELLAYLNTLYAGRSGHTPAYEHALINVLYIDGASRLAGGSQQFAEALCDVITSNGGEVLTGCAAARIMVEGRRVTGCVDAKGGLHQADWYIGAIHPLPLIDMLPEGTFLRGFTRRLRDIDLSYSAFSVYIDLKPDRFPYIPHTRYYMEDFGKIWDQNETATEEWPKGFMYMTPPEANQGAHADRLLVYAPMDWKEVKRWKDTKVGRRGNEYEEWKRERVERILDRLEKLHPGLRSNIMHIHAASPLTIRDFYNTPQGAMFGYRKDAQNILLSQLSVNTRLENLLLTGQNINLHGICGTPLTSILTAETILGTNFLVKEIGKEEGIKGEKDKGEGIRGEKV